MISGKVAPVINKLAGNRHISTLIILFRFTVELCTVLAFDHHGEVLIRVFAAQVQQNHIGVFYQLGTVHFISYGNSFVQVLCGIFGYDPGLCRYRINNQRNECSGEQTIFFML